MKFRNAFFFGLMILSFAACKKSGDKCTTVMGSPTAAEISSLQNYITSNSLTAVKDSAGFFYNIVFSGTGTDHPSAASTVSVRYRGSLTDGRVFDSTAAGVTRQFPLTNLILGWQYGLPLLKRGGTIDLYLPPSLGYGCNTVGIIPSNSNLVFRVELVNF